MRHEGFSCSGQVLQSGGGHGVDGLVPRELILVFLSRTCTNGSLESEMSFLFWKWAVLFRYVHLIGIALSHLSYRAGMVTSVSLCLMQAFFMHLLMMVSLYPLCLISDIIVLTPSSRPGSLLHLSKMILKKFVMQLIFVSGGPCEVVCMMLPLCVAF